MRWSVVESGVVMTVLSMIGDRSFHAYNICTTYSVSVGRVTVLFCTLLLDTPLCFLSSRHGFHAPAISVS